VATIRECTDQPAAGQATEPLRGQRARRVLLACRLATQHLFTDGLSLQQRAGWFGDGSGSNGGTATLPRQP